MSWEWPLQGLCRDLPSLYCHKKVAAIMIWASMITLLIVSVLVAAIFWLQRLSSRLTYGSRVPGRTLISVAPLAVLLGGE